MHAPAAATTAGARGSRWSHLKGALSRDEWRRVAAMFAVIAGLHAVGFFILLTLVVPRDFALGSDGIFGLGIGLTAYTLGLRHAFDADHIAAIDNTTRKLIAAGQRPLASGFFFSLGHSTVVFLLALLFAFGLKTLSGQVENDGSTLQTTTHLVGTTVSGTFLILIGVLNLIVLLGIVGVFRRLRGGDLDEATLERELEQGGAMSRFYRSFTGRIRASWQLYPVGLLFGLGFDTATEVALLFLAAGAAFGGLPFYAILCLPILFAAGMSLLDTCDGAFMNFAYGWANARPVRRIYYNLTVTGLSVAVALIIGTIELAAIFTEQLGLSGPVWTSIAEIDLNLVGYFIVALFILTWAVALLVWRYGHIEEKWGRWEARPGEASPVGRQSRT